MPRIHLRLLGQYTSLGLLGGFSLQVLPAYLRRAGIALPVLTGHGRTPNAKESLQP